MINYRACIWALKEEGCTHVLVTTACGSLQEHIHPGDVVIIDQFIDRTHKREQSFYGGDSGIGLPGICHMPMDLPFCERTRQILIQACKQEGIPCHERGVTVTIQGPRFSSKAESALFRSWGADLVNMTTVPEVCLAKEAGLCYASIALPTDYDCWREAGEPVSGKHPTSYLVHGEIVMYAFGWVEWGAVIRLGGAVVRLVGVVITDRSASFCQVSVAMVMKTLKDNASMAKRIIMAAVPMIAKQDWSTTLKKQSGQMPQGCFRLKVRPSSCPL